MFVLVCASASAQFRDEGARGAEDNLLFEPPPHPLNGALTQLGLDENNIGDSGTVAFADAVGKGALPALKELHMSEDAPALKAACDARGIDYY